MYHIICCIIQILYNTACIYQSLRLTDSPAPLDIICCCACAGASVCDSYKNGRRVIPALHEIFIACICWISWKCSTLCIQCIWSNFLQVIMLKFKNANCKSLKGNQHHPCLILAWGNHDAHCQVDLRPVDCSHCCSGLELCHLQLPAHFGTCRNYLF